LDYRTGIFLPKAFGYGRVVLSVSETCVLSVDDVVFEKERRLPDGTQLGPATPSLSGVQITLARLGYLAQADSQRRIWGRHLMHEQFHITTTLAYQDFTYWEAASCCVVYSPSQFDAYCWNDGVGWTTEYCTSATDTDNGGQVGRNTRGQWVNSCCGGIRHNLGSHPYAQWNYSNFWCDQVGYTMPFGWHDHCEGARVY
jgi:hypothetical protein